MTARPYAVNCLICTRLQTHSHNDCVVLDAYQSIKNPVSQIVHQLFCALLILFFIMGVQNWWIILFQLFLNLSLNFPIIFKLISIDCLVAFHFNPLGSWYNEWHSDSPGHHTYGGMGPRTFEDLF